MLISLVRRREGRQGEVGKKDGKVVAGGGRFGSIKETEGRVR